MTFKGVLLEGLEVVLIVTALGAGEDRLAPALVGAAIGFAGCSSPASPCAGR